MVLPPIAVGTFYRLIYEPSFGVVNHFTDAVIGRRFDFSGDKNLAFGATIAVDVWMWTPFMILMTLAALGSVPKAELEAAEVDRLPWLKRLWYIVLPARQVHPDARHPAPHHRRLQDDRPPLPDDQRRPGNLTEFRRVVALPHRLRGVPDGRRLSPRCRHPTGRDRLYLHLPLRPQLPRDEGSTDMSEQRAGWTQGLYHAVLWLIALVFFAPVFWIILAAFKSSGDLVSPEFRFFFTPTLDNIGKVLAAPNFNIRLTMSFVMSIGSVLLAILIAFSPPTPSPATVRPALTSSCSPALGADGAGAGGARPALPDVLRPRLDRLVPRHALLLRDVLDPLLALDPQGVPRRASRCASTRRPSSTAAPASTPSFGWSCPR
jgi:ABC-type spermidine/putrescine transport system permease subunit II